MSICAKDLREHVIRPTLLRLNQWSAAAENLLLGTAAQESQLGFRLGHDDKSSMGIYQLSAFTHVAVWDEFLVTDPDLASRVRGIASQQQFLASPHTELMTNLAYATAIAWMVYQRHRIQLPAENNIDALASCWKMYYAPRDCNYKNTLATNHTDLEKFTGNYRELVLREAKTLAA